jgi:hypothetical protein
MLILLEKIQSGLSVFLVLVLVLYVTLGIEWQPKETIGTVEALEPQTEVPGSRTGSVSPRVDPKIRAENESIMEKLRNDQRLRLSKGVKPKRKRYRVQERQYEWISKERNWIPELNLAASTLSKGRDGEASMLTLHNIKESSILNNFGIEEGDMVTLVDGEVLKFDKSQTGEYYEMFHEVLERLKSGGKVSLTVMRQGRPVHLEYEL